MIKGFVNKDLEPIAGITLEFGKRRLSARAVVDTGFNGYLSVPDQLISNSGWKFLGYEKYELATGEIVKEKVYLGRVSFNGKDIQIGALTSRTKDILIGIRLLAESILAIDFKNKDLTIERA